MIVVDSSVLIDHLTGVESPQAALWARLVEDEADDILIGDVVLLEVLRGVRDARQARLVASALTRFETASMLDPVLAVAGAAHYRRLRALGITVRKTIDLIIGTFCIAHDHVLLHHDRDFAPLAAHLGLRTLAGLPH